MCEPMVCMCGNDVWGWFVCVRMVCMCEGLLCVGMVWMCEDGLYV